MSTKALRIIAVSKAIPVLHQGCRSQGAGGTLVPQILTDHLNLSQPVGGRGGQIMPNTLLLATKDFETFLRPCIIWQMLRDLEYCHVPAKPNEKVKRIHNCSHIYLFFTPEYKG